MQDRSGETRRELEAAADTGGSLPLAVAGPGPGLAAPGRRAGTDRRQFTWRTLAFGAIHNRRRQSRRAADHALPIVDWHDAHLLAVSITILLLCSADAFLTLKLLELGATEANPVMAALVYHSVTAFTVTKMAFTGTGVVVLVLLARVIIAGRLRCAHLLYGIMAGYAVLVYYELHLLARLQQP